jgi:hypothetical protein
VLLKKQYKPHLSKAIDRSRCLLQSWYRSAIPVLRSEGPSDSGVSLRAAVLLQIRCHAALILLMTAPFGDETLFDAHIDAFRNIVELCQNVQQLEASEEDITANPVIHTLDLRIIMPLCLVACRCRDLLIRRRAIQVLLRSGRTERIWRGLVAGLMVGEIVKIEEMDLGEVNACAEIPSSNRIRLLKFHFDPGIATNFCRNPPVGFTGATDTNSGAPRTPYGRSPAFNLEWIGLPFDERRCPPQSTTVSLSVEDATTLPGPATSPWSVNLPYDWQLSLLMCV